MTRVGTSRTWHRRAVTPRGRLAGCAALCALLLPIDAHPLDCPRLPEQSNKDWDVEVKAAVGKLGPVTGAELATRTRSVTSDLLGKLPQADRVYLEQMMYASYCSALRDNKALTEAERATRIRAYNTELRKTLREPPRGAAAAPAAADPRDAARRELARIPLDYTAEAFVASVANRKTTAAQLFLKAGIDPDAVDGEGATALMAAAGNGDVAMVTALLGARASVNKRNPKGETALDWAALGGHTEVVRVLLARGADAESVNSAFVFAAQLGRAAVLGVLYERVADKRKLATEALRGAASSTFIDADEAALVEVARLLLQRGADVDAVDDNGWAALTYASERGRARLARLLVESGANVNGRCACSGWLSGGYTPLAIAVSSGHPEVADLLLQAGADLNVANNDGARPLQIAADRGQAEMVAVLLAKGADPNARDRKGNTALMQGTGSIEIVRALLARGAVVDAKNDNGVTPLMQAVARGYVDVAVVLLDAGANVNARNGAGRTPLMIAARNGQVVSARLLLQRGARAGDKDEDDLSALSHAEALSPGEFRTKLVAMLAKAGAK